MRHVFLVIVLCLSACAPLPASPSTAAVEAGGLRLTAGGTSARGDTVHLVLRNTGAALYEGGVLSCAQTERWDGSAWAEVQDGRACIAMAVTVEPGRTLKGDVVLDVPPGTYRLSHRMSARGGEAVTVSTASFRIES